MTTCLSQEICGGADCQLTCAIEPPVLFASEVDSSQAREAAG
jgi:hypothetical protein